jgi:putative tricarboxylic transport membrane protein
MKKAAFQKRKGYLVMGGGGLFAAAVYLGLAFRLPFGEMDQPGAAIFPVVVGVILMVASLATMWEGWRLDRDEQVDVPAGADLRRLLSLIGSLLGYFLTLPWLGQIISSILFCTLLMRVLTDLGWTRIVAYSLMISISLYSVFVMLLKVPMPRGIWGF